MHLCHHCYSGKAIIITHSECVFVALGIQYAVCHIIICGLSDFTVCFHIVSWTVRFLKNVIECKICVLIFCTTFAWNISHSKKNWEEHKCILVFMQSTHYSCKILMTFEFSWQIFEKKISNIKFHENLFSGSWVVSCGHMDGHDEPVSFCSFANVPKNGLGNVHTA